MCACKAKGSQVLVVKAVRLKPLSEGQFGSVVISLKKEQKKKISSKGTPLVVKTCVQNKTKFVLVSSKGKCRQ